MPEWVGSRLAVLRRQRISQRPAVFCSIQRSHAFLRQDAEMGDGEGDGLPHGKMAAPKFFLVHAGAEDESIRGFNFESVGHAQEVDVS